MRVADVRELDRQLRALLAEVDAGRMDATDVERARLEGAAGALGVVLGREPAEVLTGGGSA